MIDIDAIRARARDTMPPWADRDDVLALLAELEAHVAEIAAIRVELDEAKAERDNWRKAHGMTQQQLANTLGVTRRTVISWEHGEKMPATMVGLA